MGTDAALPYPCDCRKRKQRLEQVAQPCERKNLSELAGRIEAIEFQCHRLWRDVESTLRQSGRDRQCHCGEEYGCDPAENFNAAPEKNGSVAGDIRRCSSVKHVAVEGGPMGHRVLADQVQSAHGAGDGKHIGKLTRAGELALFPGLLAPLWCSL